MNETELRKQIEEQLSKYNKLKKPFEDRSAGLKHTYGWFGDNGPSIAWIIWAIALWGSLFLYFMPLPKIVKSISLAVVTVALLLTLFVGIIGNAAEEIWKANEPRKNREIERKNRALYKQLLGIDYNYPNYDNVDYIIAVKNKDIVQEPEEIPDNPRKVYRSSYTYQSYKSTQSQSRNAEGNSSEKSEPSNHDAQSTEKAKTTNTKKGSSQGYSQHCPRCGGRLIIRKGPYGDFYGCSNYPKCRFTRSIKKR